MEPQPKRDNFLGISILIAAFIIGGSFIYGANAKNPATREPLAKVSDAGEREDAVKSNNVTIDDDVILGDKNAPVTLIEFGDYQCPFCKRMFDDAEVRLREEYIKTGKVRMVYRDFPLDSIHPFARRAAEAAECARDQGKYWTYHDELFARQSSIPTMDFVAVADELGMDSAAFRSCYESKKYADEVEKDYQDGVAAGVRGTPATFVNGRLLSGALPYDAFKAAIEEALANP